jgi:CMP-N-acetylneuraminic acid synthetase
VSFSVLPTVLGVIIARGGSKGLPRKNILPVAGKPVIAYSIEAARVSKKLDRFVVSTDDPEIAAIAREHGAEVPFLRPAELAQDDTQVIPVLRHAVLYLQSHQGYEPGYVMLLQATSLLRSGEDIDATITLAFEKGAKNVVSVCETHHHPLLTRQIRDDGVLVEFAFGARESGSAEGRRQNLPPAYFINGAIYLTTCRELLTCDVFLPGERLAYIMPAERSLQIDTPWDLELARLIVEHGRGVHPR